MKKSGRKNSNGYRRDVLNNNPIANLRLPVASSRNFLRELEDRRTSFPDVLRPAKRLNSRSHRLTEVSRVSRSRVQSNSFRVLSAPRVVAFQAPKSVLVCVRRKRRREVMFARNKAGRRGQRSPRRNYFSSVSCRGK